jgi:hypothetical protein
LAHTLASSGKKIPLLERGGFQKTLGVNGFYFPPKDYEYLADIQLIGKSGSYPSRSPTARAWATAWVRESAPSLR